MAMKSYGPEGSRRAFWKIVDVKGPSDCWIWTGSKNSCGYGNVRRGPRGGQKQYGAHRFAWEIEVGQIPEGMSVLHTCDNPACCNIRHLYLGTQFDNMHDMSSRGRCRVKRKLTNAQVQQIRASKCRTVEMRQALGEMHGVSPSTIYDIWNNRIYKWLPKEEADGRHKATDEKADQEGYL